MKYKLILASASPRRKELLEQAGAEFEILPAQGEEVIAGTDMVTKQASPPIAFETGSARNTPLTPLPNFGSSSVAEETAKRVQGSHVVILGADTVVAFENEILGKPRDEEDAKRMLELLSGNTHNSMNLIKFQCLIAPSPEKSWPEEVPLHYYNHLQSL